VSNNAIEECESRLLENARVQIVFEMAVIERNSDAVEAEGGEELGVGVPEEIVQELVEEIFVFLAAEHGEHSFSMLELGSRVTRDEVFHVEVAAESGALENDLVPIAINNSSAIDSENRVDPFCCTPIHVGNISRQLCESLE
jgi:hypothetical protein